MPGICFKIYGGVTMSQQLFKLDHGYMHDGSTHLIIFVWCKLFQYNGLQVQYDFLIWKLGLELSTFLSLLSQLLALSVMCCCVPTSTSQTIIYFVLKSAILEASRHNSSLVHATSAGKLTWGLEDLLSGWLIHIGCVKEKKYLMTLVKDGKTDFI